MSDFTFKLPDLGEGMVEAEIAKWHIAVGDEISEDDPLVDMMTDKAAVEVASPVSGKVISVHGEAGEMVPVGSALVVIARSEEEASNDAPEAVETSVPESAGPAAQTAPVVAPVSQASSKVLTSPSIRRQAREVGIDLGQVTGTGPKGRILREDLEAALSNGSDASMAASTLVKRTGTEEHKIIGLRRVIAQRMTASKRNIPHFSYVEEIDITQLESLRQHLNSKLASGAPRLTYLPLLGMALITVLKDFPQCNAVYDAEREVLVQHHGVHLGIATQTELGLKVPVVRHAEAMSLWPLAEAMREAAVIARNNKATRKQLSGSTITLTSLGKLGGIASTPVINEPEVGIIGINKAVQRPMVVEGNIQIRLMMNISASFDHRFVDGFDAAQMIQVLKEKLENPATIFI